MHVPRIQKAHIVWGLLVSSVRKLLEKVGDLRDIAILVQSNFGIFDIYWSVLNLVKLSRIIILYFWILGMYLLFLKVKFFFGCICSRSCILKDLWKCRSRIIKELPFKFQFNLFANFDMSWLKIYFRIEVHFGEHRKFIWRISFNLVLVIVK